MLITEHLGDKINFIDRNDVFVGYDLSQNCCEYADYFISRNKDTSLDDEKEHLPDDVLTNCVFDTDFFEELDEEAVECGGHVVFKMNRIRPYWQSSRPQEHIYLHLFNCHNGYYSHGFEAKVKGQPWQEGYL